MFVHYTAREPVLSHDLWYYNIRKVYCQNNNTKTLEVNIPFGKGHFQTTLDYFSMPFSVYIQVYTCIIVNCGLC